MVHFHKVEELRKLSKEREDSDPEAAKALAWCAKELEDMDEALLREKSLRSRLRYADWQPDTLRAHIEDGLQEKEWNLSDLARAIGTTRDRVSDIVYGRVAPTPEEVDAIKKAFQS